MNQEMWAVIHGEAIEDNSKDIFEVKTVFNPQNIFDLCVHLHFPNNEPTATRVNVQEEF